ncbi:hypothetical protein M5D96_006730 [Drosophila gunungcola]|uniref:Uncharacterized protein n=1 Tax=Drosophila gunungcola TaxID=103775 RepID=A0A9Q0BQA7_9MUSC|nr:hypothetical protein M5D96_006730 [Drosophila gunungcola]
MDVELRRHCCRLRRFRHWVHHPDPWSNS